MHDISNEPYNLVMGRGNEAGYAKVTEFLKEMIFAVREIDDRKITVVTQSFPNKNNPEICDISLLAPYVDVFSIHPHNEQHLPPEEFEQAFKARIDYIESFQKPYIITECIWGYSHGRNPQIFSGNGTRYLQQIWRRLLGSRVVHLPRCGFTPRRCPWHLQRFVYGLFG